MLIHRFETISRRVLFIENTDRTISITRIQIQGILPTTEYSDRTFINATFPTIAVFSPTDANFTTRPAGSMIETQGDGAINSGGAQNSEHVLVVLDDFNRRHRIGPEKKNISKSSIRTSESST
jgi:hypothetical protein